MDSATVPVALQVRRIAYLGGHPSSRYPLVSSLFYLLPEKTIPIPSDRILEMTQVETLHRSRHAMNLGCFEGELVNVIGIEVDEPRLYRQITRDRVTEDQPSLIVRWFASFRQEEQESLSFYVWHLSRCEDL